MLVVAGINLNNLKPRVWDEASPYYLPGLRAIMVSYAEFYQQPTRRDAAMDQGLRDYLGLPVHVKIFLDNGAFYFLSRAGETPTAAYDEFVSKAQPDWWPIPQDFIPTPTMTEAEQRHCYARTMQVNLAYELAYEHDGYVPVIHVGNLLAEYTVAISTRDGLSAKSGIALGGIVPNLLRAPKAMPYKEILDSLIHVRKAFEGKMIHVFGIGGTATLHLASLLGMDSADSSGWRNRAARGIVQLPGSGDRSVADLGNWRGRAPSPDEWERLRVCTCPACQHYGLEGLKASGITGFCNRAAHNLWVLLEETKSIEKHLAQGTYTAWYKTHLDNSTYLPLVHQLVAAST